MVLMSEYKKQKKLCHLAQLFKLFSYVLLADYIA